MTQPNLLRRLKPPIVGALYVRVLRSLSLVQTFRLTSFPPPQAVNAFCAFHLFLNFVGSIQLVCRRSVPLRSPTHSSLVLPLIDLDDLIYIRIGQRPFYASHYGRTRRGRHREQALLPAQPWLPETWRPRHVRIAPDTWPLGVQAAAWITRRHRMRGSDWVKSSFFGARGRSEGPRLAHGR